VTNRDRRDSGMTGKGIGIKKGILGVILLAVALVQIFPLVWLIDFSLGTSNEMFTSGLLIIPEKVQWGNYGKAFVDGHFLLYLKNSVLINSLAVLLVSLFSIMAGYACRRMQWKLSGFVKTLLLLGMMIPIHATLLPNYKIYTMIHATDTIWALLIPYIAFSLPQALFLMTGFIEALPMELEEAAVMDGCGIYRIVFRIVTPLLKPSIATVAIMTFLNNWNEFMMASTYLSSPKWKTLPFSVLEFTGQYSSNYAVQFAVMALTAAPAVIVYISLNRHITKGVAMGAVKG
jgi:raffinose/stachyose/melibiose transport system permease protein